MAILQNEMSPRDIAGINQFSRDLRTLYVQALAAKAHAEAYALAEKLEAGLIQHFIDAGHDNTDDEYQDSRGRPHTVETGDVHVSALGAVASLGGAANLIYHGWREHTIAARNAPYLHFKGTKGWAMVKQVTNPAHAADTAWVDEAIAELDLTGFAASVVEDGYAKLFARH